MDQDRSVLNMPKFAKIAFEPIGLGFANIANLYV